jgi:hypothetical protein
MAEMTPGEPQSAADYDDRTTAAVKTVLIEIGQILGSFKGKFAIVGGAVPWLLLGNEDMPHVGTLDVDVGLDAEALGDGEYASLIDALRGHGYHQRQELRRSARAAGAHSGWRGSDRHHRGFPDAARCRDRQEHPALDQRLRGAKS